jgi:hypothetical protein
MVLLGEKVRRFNTYRFTVLSPFVAKHLTLVRSTVYTLWKRPNLLPHLSTPASVIPVLIGGADLMIPGGPSSYPHIARMI